ncbi:FAD-dependent monooxygenase [Amycolatopsis sp. NPDC051903]|uniref:FAD-dependent monooxygenase n=1 Tax=Amycolatopsis sp. NPDC051903 TaxID=3363936 RepID=UPI00379107F5
MTTEQDRRALVVGMGISGIATAIRLRQIGWEPVLVERAAQRRSGGYFVMLWGAGFAAAERLGMAENLPDHGAPGSVQWEIDRLGNRTRAPKVFVGYAGGPRSMLRGDVENAACAALPEDVEVRFSTVPTRIEQDAGGVDVTLRNTATGETATERFALVVGADGLRSTVRSLAFGPPERFLRRMGRITCAFQLSKPLTDLAQEDFAALLEPDRAMWIFGFADHLPTVLLTYRTDDVDAEFHKPFAQRLREVFGAEPTGRALGSVLDEVDAAEQVLFDSAEQVLLDTWHHGRVVLVGDSAWCVTLYSGMGVSAGLAGADLLGTELQRHPDDLATALAEWERKLRPPITDWQRMADGSRLLFNPGGRRDQLRRRMVVRGSGYPVVGPFVRRMVRRTRLSKNADVAAA